MFLYLKKLVHKSEMVLHHSWFYSSKRSQIIFPSHLLAPFLIILLSKRSQINFSSPLFTPFFIILVQKVSNYFFPSPKLVVCYSFWPVEGGEGSFSHFGSMKWLPSFRVALRRPREGACRGLFKTRLLSQGGVAKNTPKSVCYTFGLWEEERGASATPGLRNDSRLFEGPRVAHRKVRPEAHSKTRLLSSRVWKRRRQSLCAIAFSLWGVGRGRSATPGL